jgi:hypothetical protein
MNMVNAFKVGNLQITTPVGWLDVTHEIEESNPPFTLARPDGVGAIQFSTAEYRSGKTPKMTSNDLRDLLADFAQSRKLGRGYDFVSQENPFLIIAGSFDFEGRFFRVWYCSNGQDVLLVTYNCQTGQRHAELPDCESIVRNLEF